MITISSPRHPTKSPIHGGGHPSQVGRGPTLPQPHPYLHTAQAKNPHSLADFATPHPAPGEGAGKSENAKTNLLLALACRLYFG